MKIIYLFLSLLIFNMSLLAYESEDKLKAIIIGKTAKYIKWENPNDTFIITIFQQKEMTNLFKELYSTKKIKHKNIEIKFIDNIEDLGYTNILYLPSTSSKKLPKILKFLKNKNIFVVSDMRGFAEKGGTMQIYFISQKIKLRINLDVATRQHLKISSSLLRIAEVIKG